MRVAVTRQRVAAAGLDARVAIREDGFRQHRGRYGKVASIEMIEAIGEHQLPTFFAAVEGFLAQGGIACVQSILVPDEGPHYAETLRRWRERFHGSLEVRRLGYDERFVRTWDFYPAFCEAAFRTRWLGDAQLVLR